MLNVGQRANRKGRSVPRENTGLETEVSVRSVLA